LWKKYEYKELTIPWPHSNHHGPAFIAIQDSTGDGMTIEMAKLACLLREYAAILQVLSKWYDEGWEPKDQLDSNGVEINLQQSSLPSRVHDNYRLFGGTQSSTHAIPVAYHIFLRRTKKT
jgi:hypothetical protein